MQCDLCGTEFNPYNRIQRFCSNPCRFRWHKQVNPVGVERRRQVQLSYWHKADGGYIVARRRILAKERADILRRLEELQ